MITLTKPDVYWFALYDDATRLYQYDEDGTEHLFKEIDMKRLVEFIIVYYNKLVVVNLKLGVFGINGFMYETDVSSIPSQEYRLIYFKRNIHSLGPQQDNQVIYNIGFQTTVNGVNHKKIISINNHNIKIE